MFQENYTARSIGDAAPETRALFIRRTYTHLAGALLAFVLIEFALLQMPIAHSMAATVLGAPYGWMMVIGALMLVSWMARGMASSGSQSTQYLGLGLYVVMQAVVFLPMILIAVSMTGSMEILAQAGLMTGLLFAGLTSTVFITRKDFSFLGSFLAVGGFVALGLILCSFLFGFNLGLAFSAGMILLAAGSILYDTSRIMRDYPEDQYVGASLELFASVVLLLWYVLRLLMSRE